MLLYSTGIRRSELVRLRVQDIDSERRIVHIGQGFNSSRLSVPSSAAARLRWADTWMPVRDADTRRPSPTTLALWGVFSNGEGSGKRACCARRHAPSALH
jgi:integrase